MTSAGKIYEYLDSIAPFSSQMDFDNAGLLIGSKEASSQLVLLALDVTNAVVDEAKQRGAGIILSHHPLIFSPLRKIISDSPVSRAVMAGITVICAHTNLDIAPGGVNDSLAAAIGIVPDGNTDEDCFLTGTLPEKMSAEKLGEHIKSALSCRGLRYTMRNGEISRIGVACGAGGSSIYSAAAAGLDGLVTGEIKHHELLFAAEHNIAVFDLGHFRSEDMIIPVLADKLSREFPDTDFEQAESDCDIVFYC